MILATHLLQLLYISLELGNGGRGRSPTRMLGDVRRLLFDGELILQFSVPFSQLLEFFPKPGCCISQLANVVLCLSWVMSPEARVGSQGWVLTVMSFSDPSSWVSSRPFPLFPEVPRWLGT